MSRDDQQPLLVHQNNRKCSNKLKTCCDKIQQCCMQTMECCKEICMKFLKCREKHMGIFYGAADATFIDGLYEHMIKRGLCVDKIANFNYFISDDEYDSDALHFHTFDLQLDFPHFSDYRSVINEYVVCTKYWESSSRLWAMRIFILYDLSVVVILKYIHLKFYQLNHDEIPTDLKYIIKCEAIANCIFLCYFMLYWTDIIFNHLFDRNRLLYPFFMLIALLLSDSWIAVEEQHSIWFWQMLCDSGYIIRLLFIPIFKQELERYKEDIHRWSEHKEYNRKCLLLVDVCVSSISLYIIFSLFLYMIFEDWRIEHIVTDESYAQTANIFFENFLIFEWIHQFVEYVFLGHDSPEHMHTESVNEIDLYKCKYLGVFMWFSIFQSVCLSGRIYFSGYFLYDFDINDIYIYGSDSLWYFLICIGQLSVTGIVLICVLVPNILKDKKLYNVFEKQTRSLTFAGFLWILLLILQVAYANFSNWVFFVQFFINLFIYPILFMWILCGLYAFRSRIKQGKAICEKWKYMLLYVAVIFCTVNTALFIFYGVYQDVRKIPEWHNDYVYHLIFMMIVVENSLLLEALHMAFPIIIHLSLGCLHMFKILKCYHNMCPCCCECKWENDDRLRPCCSKCCDSANENEDSIL